MMERQLKTATLVILAGLSLILCSGTALLAADESDLVQQRNQVREMAHEGLCALYEVQPGARYAIEHAAGYGVFSIYGVKIFFAGGMTGKGLVHDNRTHRDDFMKWSRRRRGWASGP